jgi:hypothetical protein
MPVFDCLKCVAILTICGSRYRLMDAVHETAAIYMILMVVAGAFFFLNLALAVISTAFQDEMTAVRTAKIEACARQILFPTKSSLFTLCCLSLGAN